MEKFSADKLPIYWEVANEDGSIVLQGVTETGQTTTTGMPKVKKDADFTKVFETMPDTGKVKKGTFVIQDGKLIVVEKTFIKQKGIKAEEKAYKRSL